MKSIIISGLASIVTVLMLFQSCTPEDEFTILTKEVIEINCNSAFSGVEISGFDGNILKIGICWSKNPNPDTIDFFAVNTGVGPDFNSLMENLEIDTKYFVRAFVLSTSSKLYFGNEVSFRTSTCTGFTLGNKTYNAVQIGNQCWASENLDFGTMISGTLNMQNNNTQEKYIYGDSLLPFPFEGGLYQWGEIMNYNTAIQGISPLGWHIPSDDDWKKLELHIGLSQQQVDTIDWRGNNADKLKPGGSTGFEAQFEGYRTLSGLFADAEYGGSCYGYYWTSTNVGQYDAYYRIINHGGTAILRNYGDQDHGMAIRLIKD